MSPQGELPLEGAEPELAWLLEPLSPGEGGVDDFRGRVWRYHREYRRPMAWRDQITPYGVFVSEIMLQQTQVSRVAVKYPQFMRRFPSFRDLADASLREVLEEWSGLGYNRRARFLHHAARTIVAEHNGTLPEDPEALVALPGVGRNTAGSISAFAFNRPVAFLETNIRTVYIYYFFPEEEGVTDRRLLPLVEETLDREEPREWFYALMDVGVFLKGRVGNLTRKSRSYTRQSPFKGSRREVRGAVLRLLTERRELSPGQLRELLPYEEERLIPALTALEEEGFIAAEGEGRYRIRE